MIIAYYNLGVEHEYLNEYELALLSFKKAYDFNS